MDDLDEALARQRAQADQARAGTADLAATLVTFRAHLIFGGFSPEDAVEFTREYFLRILDVPGGGEGDE